MVEHVICPSCVSTDTEMRGSIPVSRAFAGSLLTQGAVSGLWVCRDCSLGFRFPPPPAAEVERLYRDAPDTVWLNEFDARQDWIIARDWIHHGGKESPTILDIGCSTGMFVSATAGHPERRFGLEPSSAAASVAAQRGVSVLAESLSELSRRRNDIRFDYITAFDVIEHIANPKLFVSEALKFLHDGGSLLIATGDFSSRAFRLMQASYWYAVIPEHLSFVSPAWFTNIASELPIKIKRLHKYSHLPSSSRRRLYEATANIIYKVSPPLFGLLRTSGFGTKSLDADDRASEFPPSWMSARDHFILEVGRL